MTVSPEILAAQEAYKARPFFVLWRDSHCSVPQRFNTEVEAYDYVFQQWARIKATVARERYHASSMFGYFGGYLQGPDGFKIPLGYITLCQDVSSY